MKLSNKILLITGLIILIAMTGLTLKLKSLMDTSEDQSVKPKNKQGLLDSSVATTYNFEDFSKVNTDVATNIQFKKAKNYNIEVSSLEYINELDKLKVNKKNNILNIDYEAEESLPENRLQITIELPELLKVKSAKAANITINDFDQNKMEFDLSGTINLRAEDNQIDTLYLNTSGATKADFNNSYITNANINSSGTSDITLNMNGGYLKGDISGAVKLTYSGNVTEESINSSGTTKIIHPE